MIQIKDVLRGGKHSHLYKIYNIQDVVVEKGEDLEKLLFRLKLKTPENINKIIIEAFADMQDDLRSISKELDDAILNAKLKFTSEYLDESWGRNTSIKVRKNIIKIIEYINWMGLTYSTNEKGQLNLISNRPVSLGVKNENLDKYFSIDDIIQDMDILRHDFDLDILNSIQAEKILIRIKYRSLLTIKIKFVGDVEVIDTRMMDKYDDLDYPEDVSGTITLKCFKSNKSNSDFKNWYKKMSSKNKIILKILNSTNDKLFENIYQHLKESDPEYAGTCRTNGPYYNTTGMAQDLGYYGTFDEQSDGTKDESNFIEIELSEFNTLIPNWRNEIKKKKGDWLFLKRKNNEIAVAYNFDNDIHYFWLV